MNSLQAALIKLGVPARNVKTFLKKIRVKPNGCWEYIGTKAGRYYKFSIHNHNPHTYSVHRLLFQAETGIEPSDVLDSPCGCVNPAHQINYTRSAYLMSKSVEDRGGRHINWPMVHRIRSLPKSTNWRALSRELNICDSTLRLIRKNKAWRDECFNQSILNDGESRLISKGKTTKNTTLPISASSGRHPWRGPITST